MEWDSWDLLVLDGLGFNDDYINLEWTIELQSASKSKQFVFVFLILYFAWLSYGFWRKMYQH